MLFRLFVRIVEFMDLVGLVKSMELVGRVEYVEHVQFMGAVMLSR